TPSIQKNNNCPSTAQKRKAMSNISAPMPVKRTSSISSMDSSSGAISPISSDEHQMDNQQITTPTSVPSSSISLVCTLCDYVAASKEGLGVHLFQHACKKSDLLNRSLLASMNIDPATKLMELFNGKIASFTNANGIAGQV
ncbi:unnamed protein product, partial [Rotaria socialis]